MNAGDPYRGDEITLIVKERRKPLTNICSRTSVRFSYESFLYRTIPRQSPILWRRRLGRDASNTLEKHS